MSSNAMETKPELWKGVPSFAEFRARRAIAEFMAKQAAAKAESLRQCQEAEEMLRFYESTYASHIENGVSEDEFDSTVELGKSLIAGLRECMQRD